MDKNSSNNSGSILVTVLILMLFLTTVLFGLVIAANANLSRARSRILLLQAQYSAESGADEAIAKLNSGNVTYTGSSGEITILSSSKYRATFQTSIANTADPKKKIITSTGKIYAPSSSAVARNSRTIRITVERTSTTTASSILSRNIIDIGSGVKSITAKDIYVNNYMLVQKNTTDIIAENITIAGKYTSAANCSLTGSGALVKPTSFSNPTQTKTNLTFAYNNCITPPGNTTNVNFTVNANNPSISKIQSTYIPWSDYMDASYTNSAVGCSDWTSGGAIRDIPRSGNDKKTHYPDNGSNLATSCGTNGDINLGNNQYNIRDNVHLRASLCAASQCTPTFNNPDSTIKFIFVEGSVNFESVKTAATSGPIALIVYGADPASKSADCPYGGAAYIGQSGNGNTDARDLFIMAMNGLCIDKTKFDSSPALGGIAGKNIYVAANPSTPRPLGMDPNFPVSQIPIDLYWRQSTYLRL